MTRWIRIDGEPTASQMISVGEFEDFFYVFIDDGGTMKATDEQAIASEHKVYLIVEGSDYAEGYPTVDDEPIAMHRDADLMSKGSIRINGVVFKLQDVPHRYGTLATMYSQANTK